ncbi:MAG: thiamine-binding protein [Actinobacteria bacterium]|nr:thiamine-binding protein [Actinomycetota bacterium]
MIAEIQVLPTPAGTATDRYAHVDAAIAALRAAGLRVEVGALGTTLEGPPGAGWAALRRAHEATLSAGAVGVVTVLKVAEGAGDGPDSGPSIDDLLAGHRP